MKKLLQPKVRKYAYGVATAALATAGTAGLIDGDLAQSLVGLAAAVTGMAFLNTSPDEPEA